MYENQMSVGRGKDTLQSRVMVELGLMMLLITLIVSFITWQNPVKLS